MLSRLRELDHKALNSRWGLLLVPVPWLLYRLGRRLGGTRERVGAYVAFGPVGGAILNRGRAEGEPLPQRRPRRPS